MPIDYAVLNTHRIDTSQRQRYAAERSEQVENDVHEIRKLGPSIVAADLLQRSNTVRHDPDAVASVAIRLALEGRRWKERVQHAS